MKMDSKKELHSKVQVKLFVTELCPQCVIAIKRIEEIVEEIKEIDLDIINFSNLNNGNKKIKKLAATPYFVIDEKFVVPGTSSKIYIEDIIQSALTNTDRTI